MIGKVKWFSDARGFGFITGEDGKDTFVHFSGIIGTNGDRKTLVDGQKVQYDIVESDKGPKAANVTKLLQ